MFAPGIVLVRKAVTYEYYRRRNIKYVSVIAVEFILAYNVYLS